MATLAALASEARQDLISLVRLALSDLSAASARLRTLPADEARDALVVIVEAIGNSYGDAAAALAADYFDNARDAAAVRGRFHAAPATAPTPARWQALVRWGVDPLYAENPDWPTTLVRIGGGLQRTVADQHRLTIVTNSIRDPQASGWKRVGVGENCGFCRMLIDRGHVYTEAGVTFRSHDHCNCAAAPSWDDRVVKVSREPYRQSQRNRSDAMKAADNRRAREYIADNYGD